MLVKRGGGRGYCVNKAIKRKMTAETNQVGRLCRPLPKLGAWTRNLTSYWGAEGNGMVVRQPPKQGELASWTQRSAPSHPISRCYDARLRSGGNSFNAARSIENTSANSPAFFLADVDIFSAARTVVSFFLASDMDFLLLKFWLLHGWWKSGRERRVFTFPSDALLSW